ncbi:MAG: YceI family protein [Acidimicrobiales bacterium]|nr:YceI family protein [Acidimicrobiales bacterium]
MARLRKLDLGRLSILVVLLIGTAAIVTKDQWDWIFEPDEAETQGVSAETLTIDDDAVERLYRISPNNGSAVSYTVEESLAGSDKVSTGVTHVVAGDIIINTEDPASSQVGEVVVNVEMFDSDSSLRDKRLRHDFLESTHWPFARFAVNAIDGLDVDFTDGETYDVSLTGDLTVKETTSEETFTGTVTVTGEQLVASVSAEILSSTYGVGPINIARLAQTKDEVTLTFELVADRVAVGSEADDGELETDIPEFAVAGGAFADTVQPILEENCVSCHISGGPGWDTLAFDTAADAAEVAEDIALVTEIRFMPPWLPGGDSPAFEHDWSLSDDEIATIGAWAADGGGLDVAPDTELVARGQAIIPIEEDQVIVPRDGPYTTEVDEAGQPLLADEYRCQVHEVDDPEGDGTWIKGYEFRPDQKSIVHHSIIYLAPEAALDEIARKSAEDERPGWTCFGTSNLSTDGVGNMGGWAPGQAPTVFPDGYGLFIPSGFMVINQIHFHHDYEALEDNSLIILDEATPEQIDGITGIAGSSYLTPAEVPCTPEEEAIAAEREATIDGYVNLCVRENVIEEIREKYDNFATFIPNALLLQCGGTVDDYDDLDGSIGYSSCDLRARNPGTIYTVLGHMHEFGDAYRMTLNPDTPEEMVLLDIPDWDFEWQLNYDLVEDVEITRADTIRFECWWDRTRVYLPEPRYITWNEGTVDEMCFSSVTVLPEPGDHGSVTPIGS